MNPILTADELSRFGLETVAVGDAEVLPVPEEIVSKGATTTGIASFQDVVEGTEETDFLELKVHAATVTGFSLERAERNPAILMARSHEAPFRLEGQDAEGTWREDPETVLFDLARLKQPVALLFADDTGIALRPTDDDFLIGPILGRPIDVPRFAAITSDIEVWVGEETDVWLAEKCRNHLKHQGLYHHVVAIGLLARLKTPENITESVRRIFEGEYDPVADRERAWARNLDENQIEAIETSAVAEVILLEEHLERLFEFVDSIDPSWHSAVLDALCRRDDLEGVRVLLAARIEDNALQMAVKSLDQTGLHFVISVPPLPEAVRNVRLRRAASVNPEAWWVRPVVNNL